jgi:hypothetical protein
VQSVDGSLVCWFAGSVKTTIDLPADLVREVKMRAVREGRKMKELVAELLERSLRDPRRESPRGVRRPGLPVIACAHAPREGTEMTPERVAAILVEQEKGWVEDARRR